MEFYAKRSVYEQANRLPLELREKYQETQLDRIEIDGVEIMGYFEYSFLEEKSYFEQPVRSDDGSIESIDSYNTFLTPRLIIKYNMMHIDDYRKLMKLLKSKNAFMVTCYDIVEDCRVTHEMYFAPPSMPIIYQQYLMALGIREYTIELIGTNRKKSFEINYYYNLPIELEERFRYEFPLVEPFYYSPNIPQNKPYVIGEFELPDGRLLSDWAADLGYISNWNTEQNGTGIAYANITRYFIYKDLKLYAQWSMY